MKIDVAGCILHEIGSKNQIFTLPGLKNTTFYNFLMKKQKNKKQKTKKHAKLAPSNIR